MSVFVKCGSLLQLLVRCKVDAHPYHKFPTLLIFTKRREFMTLRAFSSRIMITFYAFRVYYGGGSSAYHLAKVHALLKHLWRFLSSSNAVLSS